MFNLSSAMGIKFAEIAIDMTRQVTDLGPSPLNPDMAVQTNA
jgi:coenzyme F420-reducing hydrogenase delta subunit